MVKMRTALVTVIVSMLLVSLVFEVYPLTVDANFKPAPPTIKVLSPTDQATYYTNSITLNINIISMFDYSDTTRKAEYTLDGSAYAPLQLNVQMVNGSSGNYPYSKATASLKFPKLSDGEHLVIVTAEYTFRDHPDHPWRAVKVIHFIVETTNIPSPTVSPTSPNITPTPSIPEFPATLVFIVLAGVILAGTLVFKRATITKKASLVKKP
jgi:hypothetical protein